MFILYVDLQKYSIGIVTIYTPCRPAKVLLEIVNNTHSMYTFLSTLYKGWTIHALCRPAKVSCRNTKQYTICVDLLKYPVDIVNNTHCTVWSETNAQGEITFIRIILKTPFYFRTILVLIPVDSPCQFRRTFHSSPNGGSRLVFGDGADDPIKARLDALLGQQDACQLRLRSLTEKQECRGNIRQIGQVVFCLYEFPAILSPRLWHQCWLWHRPWTETSPGMTI